MHTVQSAHSTIMALNINDKIISKKIANNLMDFGFHRLNFIWFWNVSVGDQSSKNYKK